MKMRLSHLVILCFATVIRAHADDAKPVATASLEGDWALVSMEDNGLVIPKEKCEKTKAIIRGKQMILDQYWHPVFTKVDLKTGKGDGYLEGNPGKIYTLDLVPSEGDSAIDFVLKGVHPKKAESDLSPDEMEALRGGLVRSKGIYNLNGDTLTMSWGDWTQEKGSKRPVSFTGKASSHQVLLVFRRLQTK